MNAVERLLEYTTNLPQEPPAYIGADLSPESWPSRGAIVVRDLTASYHSRPDKPVLRNLNLVFQPGETIYIVGRTGSGKSTLLSVLLRLIEIGEGSVEIDGQGLFLKQSRLSLYSYIFSLDISSLGLATLRRAMELIPQGWTILIFCV
jgi:ATP-binding cassette subfamily C (CFTR/MRP) protein 1